MMMTILLLKVSLIFLLFVIYYYCYHYYYLLLLLLLTVRLRFQEWSQTSNLTIQPPLSPGHLKEGRYLVLKVGEIDRGE